MKQLPAHHCPPQEPVPEPTAAAAPASSLSTPDASASPSAANPSTDATPTPEKVHIRGVDELTTDDLLHYASTRFPTESPLRVEWIDDTSANLVYGSAETGLAALDAFTAVQERHEGEEGIAGAAAGDGGAGGGGRGSTNPEPTESTEAQVAASANTGAGALRLRTAHSMPSHPDSVLLVRSAVSTDRKRQRAHEASRFYLMHPELDPRARGRREFEARRRLPKTGRSQREGSGDSDGDYTRRRFDEWEHRRRRDRDHGRNGFNANMYDDDEMDDEGDDDVRPSNRTKELFPNSESGSGGGVLARARSASPNRMDFDDEEDAYSFTGGGGGSGSRAGSRLRFRTRSPPRRLRANGANANAGRELFPDTGNGGTPLKNELLFANGGGSPLSIHRRSDAFDAADETDTAAPAATAAKRLPLDGTGTAGANTHKELFPETAPDRNRLQIRGAASDGNPGISIRGSSAGANDSGNGAGGLAIKGTAVRELFPSSLAGNRSKELFADIPGPAKRGGRRKKAEDMFN